MDYKIIILGSSYLTELVVERLAGFYNLVGYVPSRSPAFPGNISLPVLDSFDVEHDIKLSIQWDRKLADIENAYNVHTGLLPDYGGLDILAHTLVNGDREQGITFHKMVENFDAGPIISKTTYPVFADDTSFDLYGRLSCILPGFVHSSVELVRLLTDEQVSNCYAYPPRMYHRGPFELCERFEEFQAHLVDRTLP